MATQAERDELRQALWDKYTSLNDWEHEFNRITPVNQRPNHEGVLRSVQAEREQLVVNMKILSGGQEPPAFPSPETIARLQAATGDLQQATLHSDNGNRFFEAVNTVFTTWPFSNAG